MKHLPYAFNANKEANESCLTLCHAHLYTRGIFQFKDVLIYICQECIPGTLVAWTQWCFVTFCERVSGIKNVKQMVKPELQNLFIFPPGKIIVFNLPQNMAFSNSNIYIYIYTFKTIQNLKSHCY